MRKSKTKTLEYTKTALISSERYGDYIDLLRVLLDDNQTYTFDSVDKLLKEYLESEVV